MLGGVALIIVMLPVWILETGVRTDKQLGDDKIKPFHKTRVDRFFWRPDG